LFTFSDYAYRHTASCFANNNKVTVLTNFFEFSRGEICEICYSMVECYCDLWMLLQTTLSHAVMLIKLTHLAQTWKFLVR